MNHLPLLICNYLPGGQISFVCVIALETSNGAIAAEVPAIGNNGLRVRTNNGRIELNLASDLNADIEAKTSNSDVKLDEIEVMLKRFPEIGYLEKLVAFTNHHPANRLTLPISLNAVNCCQETDFKPTNKQ